MAPKSDSTSQQPGADRFWGQFSQSRAGRSPGESEPDERGPDERSQQGSGHECLEWCPICRSAELFRTAVSPELRQQAESIQHEAMGVLKAFLDAYAEKTGGEPAARPAPAHEPEPDPAPRVTDIPLD